MPESEVPAQRKRIGKIVSVAIPAAALITGLLVINETTRYPRTDDAEVFANFIGIAPQVDGPISTLAVQDNAFIKQGGLLFEIDPRPYEYALQQARSDRNTLEGQIVDQTPDDRVAKECGRGGWSEYGQCCCECRSCSGSRQRGTSQCGQRQGRTG